jgi:hypothetical protein
MQYKYEYEYKYAYKFVYEYKYEYKRECKSKCIIQGSTLWPLAAVQYLIAVPEACYNNFWNSSYHLQQQCVEHGSAHNYVSRSMA